MQEIADGRRPDGRTEAARADLFGRLARAIGDAAHHRRPAHAPLTGTHAEARHDLERAEVAAAETHRLVDLVAAELLAAADERVLLREARDPGAHAIDGVQRETEAAQ